VQRQHQLGQRSGGLDSGWAAPDDDYVDRTGLARRRIVHRGFQKALKMQPQTFGVGHRIQRKCVLCGAGHSEEIGPSTRRHHQMRPLQRPPVGERESACGQVCGDHLRGHHVDRGIFAENGPVGRQRLELVVIVAVNQRHLDPGITELAGAGHTSEPATKN
jgi:hypothetical protein